VLRKIFLKKKIKYFYQNKIDYFYDFSQLIKLNLYFFINSAVLKTFYHQVPKMVCTKINLTFLTVRVCCFSKSSDTKIKKKIIILFLSEQWKEGETDKTTVSKKKLSNCN